MARPSSRRQLVSNELLEHAARLFTSLQDIADSMGVSRPTIYTYVRNKDELLAALVHDVLDPTVRLLEEVAARTDLARTSAWPRHCAGWPCRTVATPPGSGCSTATSHACRRSWPRSTGALDARCSGCWSG
jgi:AcrR family transcriptional regulator